MNLKLKAEQTHRKNINEMRKKFYSKWKNYKWEEYDWDEILKFCIPCRKYE